MESKRANLKICSVVIYTSSSVSANVRPTCEFESAIFDELFKGCLYTVIIENQRMELVYMWSAK